MRCFFDSCTICRYIPAGRRCLVSGLFLLAAGDASGLFAQKKKDLLQPLIYNSTEG
jgi:hypothetical protein